MCWIENYHSLFIPVKFFHCFLIPVFLPWHFHCSTLCFENDPWPLGIATRSFSSNPFRFFSFCFVSVLFFPSFAFKIVLGNYQKELFSNPFRFFSEFASFWLCFLPLPSKFTLEIAKSSFLPNLLRCFFFVLATFPPFAFKIDLGNCQKELFLELFSLFVRFLPCFFRFGYFSSFAFKIDFGNGPKELFLKPFLCFVVFSVFFFVLAIFPPVPSKLTLEIVKRSFFSNLFRFLFVFSVFFSFWLFFAFAFKIDLGNCQKELFLEPFSFFSPFVRFGYVASFALVMCV